MSRLLNNIKIKSVCEFGCNIGNNLIALSKIYKDIVIDAIEINENASIGAKQNIPQANIYNESLLNFTTDKRYDLTFISGVLIHQDPNKLPIIYKKLYDYSNKYIIISEYYNPVPVEVEYRGHSGKLFKRDWAKDIMTLYPDLELIHYGFLYNGDSICPSDDITYFVFRKP